MRCFSGAIYKSQYKKGGHPQRRPPFLYFLRSGKVTDQRNGCAKNNGEECAGQPQSSGPEQLSGAVQHPFTESCDQDRHHRQYDLHNHKAQCGRDQICQKQGDIHIQDQRQKAFQLTETGLLVGKRYYTNSINGFIEFDDFEEINADGTFKNFDYSVVAGEYLLCFLQTGKLALTPLA